MWFLHYSDILMSVSNRQPHDWLLNRIFRHRSKKASKLRVTGLCEGNSPVTGEFPAQRASDAENVSIWWRHHVGGCCFGAINTTAKYFYRQHDEVIIWKRFPCYWPFVRGIHRPPVTRIFIFTYLLDWISGSTNGWVGGDLGRYGGHYDVAVRKVTDLPA